LNETTVKIIGKIMRIFMRYGILVHRRINYVT
jgi:hypothetical protein